MLVIGCVRKRSLRCRDTVSVSVKASYCCSSHWHIINNTEMWNGLTAAAITFFIYSFFRDALCLLPKKISDQRIIKPRFPQHWMRFIKRRRLFFKNTKNYKPATCRNCCSLQMCGYQKSLPSSRGVRRIKISCSKS